MRYVVGLGNPGPKYAETRHNFGFLCLDELTEKLKTSGAVRQDSGDRPKLAHWERWLLADGSQALLLWPLTYMNLSGQALEVFLAQFPAEGSEILLVIDDMSLPLGQVRLRRKGSSGGHNGLKSIEAALGHQEYPRLRLGIGSPEADQEVIDFVLEPFPTEDLSLVKTVNSFAAEQILEWLAGVSFDALMGKVNGWRGAEEVER